MLALSQANHRSRLSDSGKHGNALQLNTQEKKRILKKQAFSLHINAQLRTQEAQEKKRKP